MGEVIRARFGEYTDVTCALRKTWKLAERNEQ